MIRSTFVVGDEKCSHLGATYWAKLFFIRAGWSSDATIENALNTPTIAQQNRNTTYYAMSTAVCRGGFGMFRIDSYCDCSFY